MVGSRRSSMNRGLSLKAQYETALHDLTNLVDTAQDKMAADQKMTVTSVIEVQMLLDKHKVRTVANIRVSHTFEHCFMLSSMFIQEFFQGLECHMILTQTFYSKAFGLVAQRESQALEETMTLAQNVLKQAHRRGVELEGILEVRMKDTVYESKWFCCTKQLRDYDTILFLLQSWSRLVEDYQGLCRQLEAVECSIPTVGLVEETEDKLIERICLYQARNFVQAAHTKL